MTKQWAVAGCEKYYEAKSDRAIWGPHGFQPGPLDSKGLHVLYNCLKNNLVDETYTGREERWPRPSRATLQQDQRGREVCAERTVGSCSWRNCGVLNVLNSEGYGVLNGTIKSAFYEE